MSTRRNFHKGALGAIAAFVAIAHTTARTAVNHLYPTKTTQYRSTWTPVKCPECNSPVAECL